MDEAKDANTSGATVDQEEEEEEDRNNDERNNYDEEATKGCTSDEISDFEIETDPHSLSEESSSVEESIDKGEEADSESDKSVSNDRNIKKKTKVLKNRAHKKSTTRRKLKKMHQPKAEDGRNEKRTKQQLNKRRKIRKLLTEDKLNKETKQALKEEDDRRKRLELQANLNKEATNSKTFADLGLDFPDFPYDFNYTGDFESLPDLGTYDLSASGIDAMNNEAIGTSNIVKSTLNTSHAGSSQPCIASTDVKTTSSSVKAETFETEGTKTANGDADIEGTSRTTPSVSLFEKLLQPKPIVTSMPPVTFRPMCNVTVAVKKPVQSAEVICISSESSDDDKLRKKNSVGLCEPINISSGTDSSDDVIFAGTDDNDVVVEDPDINNSGSHVDDNLNVPNLEGSVVVNVNRSPDEEEISLPPRLAQVVKPHQIGGIRFMFDNIVESIKHYETSRGFGCILAHSMGLGKTLQVISFIDVFLKHTGAKTVLCVVPVNTLLNWLSEFQLWLPEYGGALESLTSNVDAKRGYKVQLLTEIHKTCESRAKVIASWKSEGGVLLMGYEMYRLLTNQKSKKRKKKAKSSSGNVGIIDFIDLDEDDRLSRLTMEIFENLVNPGPDLMVCDEGHRIKNSHASISQALKQIATRRRIVLTGYPLQNNLMEYWCMVDFVRPNFLGTKQEFANMFERPILNGQCADSNAGDVKLMRCRSHVLHSLLKGFVQRRSHVVLRGALPPKEEYVLMVRMSEWQKKLYNTFIKQQVIGTENKWCTIVNPIKAFSICCKIWNHPDVLYRTVVRKTIEEQQNSGSVIDVDLDIPDPVLDGTMPRPKRRKKNNLTASNPGDTNDKTSQGLNPFYSGEREKGLTYEWAKDLLCDYKPYTLEFSGKFIILMQIVHHSVASGDKILVFSQSLTTLTLIEDFLSERDVPSPPGSSLVESSKWKKNESYFRLDGNTSTTEREKMINIFNASTNDKIHLFLLSTRAGCLGINLVGANRVVVFDVSWNPCHDAQAVCRVYRYGQVKKCMIYRLVCDQSMEKRIYDRQISKQGMSDRIVDELNPVQKLERQDITKLLIYSDDDPPSLQYDQCVDGIKDETLINTCKLSSRWLTKKPFLHESLHMDCKSQRLTKAEKREAQSAYEREKKASASCSYSRPSYSRYYAAAGYPRKTNTPTPLNSNNNLTNGSNLLESNIRPTQSTPYPLKPTNHRLSTAQGLTPNMIDYLKKSGIVVREMIAPSDIPQQHPSQQTSENGMDGSIKPLIAAGQQFYMIQGRKGVYIGTMCGRIFAIRSQKTDERNTASPLVRAWNGQMIPSREYESHIIKSAFSSISTPVNSHFQSQQSATGRYINPNQVSSGHQYPGLGSRLPYSQSSTSQQNYLTNGDGIRPGSFQQSATTLSSNNGSIGMQQAMMQSHSQSSYRDVIDLSSLSDTNVEEKISVPLSTNSNNNSSTMNTGSLNFNDSNNIVDSFFNSSAVTGPTYHTSPMNGQENDSVARKSTNSRLQDCENLSVSVNKSDFSTGLFDPASNHAHQTQMNDSSYLYPSNHDSSGSFLTTNGVSTNYEMEFGL